MVKPVRVNQYSPAPRNNNEVNIDTPSKNSSDPIAHAFDVNESANEQGDLFSSIIGQWLFPGVQQEREFAQQVAFQREQNEWNSEQARMERAKEAGINPVTAGQQIVGGASPSVGSPNSTGNAGTIGEPLNAINGAVSSAASLADSIGSNRLKNIQGGQIEHLLRPQILEILSSVEKNLKDAGYSDMQAKILSKQLPFVSRKESLTIANMFLQLPILKQQLINMRVEKNVMLNRIDEIEQHIKEMGSSIALNEKLALQAEKNALLLNSKKMELDWLNSIRNAYNIDPSMPVANNLLTMAMIYGYDDSRYKVALQSIYDYDERSTTASRDAFNNTLEDELSTRFNYTTKELYLNKELQKELMKYGVKGDMIRSVVDAVTGFASKSAFRGIFGK